MKQHIEKAILYKWLDGELAASEIEFCQAHINNCVPCRKEWEALSAFGTLLKSSSPSIEASPSFEAAFWKKAAERQAEESPLSRARAFLESLFPVPNLSGAFAVLTIAFLVGSAGGAVSGIGSHAGDTEPRLTLSGTSEYQGLPASSVAASYLKTIEERTS